MRRLKRFHTLLGLTSSGPELAITSNLHCGYPGRDQTHHHDPPWPIAHLGQEDDGISYSHGRAPWAAAGWTAPALADTSGPEDQATDQAVMEGTSTGLAEAVESIAFLAVVDEGIPGHQAAGLSDAALWAPRAPPDSTSGADSWSGHSRRLRQTCAGVHRRNTRRKRVAEIRGDPQNHRRLGVLGKAVLAQASLKLQRAIPPHRATHVFSPFPAVRRHDGHPSHHHPSLSISVYCCIL